MECHSRKELCKEAKSLGEEGKVAVRNIRRDTVDAIKKAEKVSF
jgi:ribosome recycling factor